MAKKKEELTVHDKEDLLALIYNGVGNIEGKFSSFVNKFLISVAIFVSVLVAVLTVGFTHIGNVETEIKNIGDDLTDIDGALKREFPDSAVFGQRHKREINKRGN